MMLSVMVVGAGAVVYNDQNDIVNTEAVDAMYSLKIMQGDPTGNFRPNDSLTRAEVAKMIVVAKNGGKDPVMNPSNAPMFTDIKGHWAQAYIEACASMGVVAGYGDGKFLPEQKITVVEAAKMWLVALGYDADQEQMVGAFWNTYVNQLAINRGLYDGFKNVDIAAEASRDTAALLGWNAVQAIMVGYEYTLVGTGTNLTSKVSVEDRFYDGVYDNGDELLSLLEHAYSATVEDDFILAAVEEDAYGTYTVMTANPATGAITADSTYTEVAEDYSALMGQKVDVLHSDNDEVYGIYANEDAKVIVEGICEDLKVVTANSAKVKVAGVEYKTNGNYASIPVYNFNELTGGNLVAAGNLGAYVNSATNDDTDPYAIDMIDNNDDGKIDLAVVYPFSVEEVTYASASTVTITTRGALDLDDIDCADTLAKDDYVIVFESANTVSRNMALEKVDVVSGEILAVKDGSTVKVNDTWYQVASTSNDTLSASALESTVNLFVVNGFYFAADIVAAADASTNVLFVSAAKSIDTNLGDPYVTIKAYFADGTDKTVDVVEVNGNKVAAVHQLYDGGAPKYAQYTGDLDSVVVGAMYRYEIDKNGDYELFALTNSAEDRAGYDAYDAKGDGTVAFDTDTDRLTVNSSFTIAEDAVVFVQAPKNTTGDTVKVITGKALMKWADNSALYAQVLSNDVKGNNEAQVISLLYVANAPIVATSDNSFGYVTATPERVPTTDGDRVWQYEIWNGSKTLTVFEDDSTQHAYEGDFVQFNVINESEIDDLTTALSNGTYAAVTGLPAADKIDVKSDDGTSTVALKIDAEDTKVIYIDSSVPAGVEGGAIALANEPTSGNYTMNVYIAASTMTAGATLDVIFVDTKNDMADATYAATVDTDDDVLAATTTYTLTRTVSDVDFATTTTKVADGASVYLTITTSDAVVPTGGKDITVICNETGERRTVTFDAGDIVGTRWTITFDQQEYATTYSILDAAAT